MLTNIINYVVSAYRADRLSEELSGMTDRELADIGIARSDIHRIVDESVSAMRKEAAPVAAGAKRSEPSLVGLKTASF